MSLSILAMITAMIGVLAKLAPVITDAVNRHYAKQVKKENANVDLAQAIASHDPARSGPMVQSLADRLLRYKARLAALGRLQRPHP